MAAGKRENWRNFNSYYIFVTIRAIDPNEIFVPMLIDMVTVIFCIKTKRNLKFYKKSLKFKNLSVETVDKAHPREVECNEVIIVFY